MFVFISVYCGLCKCNRSYHCESAWSHPEPRSDPRSRPDSTVMGDRTGSPVGDYDMFFFCCLAEPGRVSGSECIFFLTGIV